MEIVRTDGLFEPGDVGFGEDLCEVQCRLGCESTVGVDEEFSVVADDVAHLANTRGIILRMRAYLDLHASYAVAHPVFELGLHLCLRVVGEAATAVHGDAFTNLAEELAERKVEEFRFEVPKGCIYR